MRAWWTVRIAGWLALSACSPVGANEAATPADLVEDDSAGPERRVAPGPLDPIVCHHQQVRFSAGVYKGDLILSGSHCEIIGAGDETTVDGNLEIRGESNTVSSMTILGTARMSGSHGRLDRVRFKSSGSTPR
jgi:hypothetical protein